MKQVPTKMEDSRQEALSWKARLTLRLHHLRHSRPGRLMEKIVWWIAG